MVSYTLLLSLIEYKTLVLREDMEAAQQLLPSIPKVRLPFLTRIKCPAYALGGLVLLQPAWQIYLYFVSSRRLFMDLAFLPKTQATACMANMFTHAAGQAKCTSGTHKAMCMMRLQSKHHLTAKSYIKRLKFMQAVSTHPLGVTCSV